MKFRNNLINFMKNRYGIDQLGIFLFRIYIILVIVNIFAKNVYLTVINILILLIIIYRFTSKRIYKRSIENKKYNEIKKKILNVFKKKKNIYKKCRYCDTILKLPIPSKIGIKHVKCPNCRNRNTYLILKRCK